MITHEAQMKGAETLKRRADQRAQWVLDMARIGATHQQIADWLGCNLRSVPKILSRCRRRLAERAAAGALSPDPQPGEYYVDPDAREAYEPDGGVCT